MIIPYQLKGDIHSYFCCTTYNTQLVFYFSAFQPTIKYLCRPVPDIAIIQLFSDKPATQKHLARIGYNILFHGVLRCYVRLRQQTVKFNILRSKYRYTLALLTHFHNLCIFFSSVAKQCCINMVPSVC